MYEQNLRYDLQAESEVEWVYADDLCIQMTDKDPWDLHIGNKLRQD